MPSNFRPGAGLLLLAVACREPRTEPSDAAPLVVPASATSTSVIVLDAATEMDATVDAARPKLGGTGCAACAATEYCLRKDTMVHGQAYGVHSTMTCERLPAACASKPSCACVVGDAPANCSIVDGQVRVWFPARNP